MMVDKLLSRGKRDDSGFLAFYLNIEFNKCNMGASDINVLL